MKKFMFSLLLVMPIATFAMEKGEPQEGSAREDLEYSGSGTGSGTDEEDKFSGSSFDSDRFSVGSPEAFDSLRSEMLTRLEKVDEESKYRDVALKAKMKELKEFVQIQLLLEIKNAANPSLANLQERYQIIKIWDKAIRGIKGQDSLSTELKYDLSGRFENLHIATALMAQGCSKKFADQDWKLIKEELEVREKRK